MALLLQGLFFFILGVDYYYYYKLKAKFNLEGQEEK